jgi:hypothetical protein
MHIPHARAVRSPLPYPPRSQGPTFNNASKLQARDVPHKAGPAKLTRNPSEASPHTHAKHVRRVPSSKTCGDSLVPNPRPHIVYTHAQAHRTCVCIPQLEITSGLPHSKHRFRTSQLRLLHIHKITPPQTSDTDLRDSLADGENCPNCTAYAQPVSVLQYCLSHELFVLTGRITPHLFQMAPEGHREGVTHHFTTPAIGQSAPFLCCRRTALCCSPPPHPPCRQGNMHSGFHRKDFGKEADDKLICRAIGLLTHGNPQWWARRGRRCRCSVSGRHVSTRHSAWDNSNMQVVVSPAVQLQPVQLQPLLQPALV